MKRTAIPASVADNPEALEAVTVWIANGSPVVSMNLSVGFKRPDGEPDAVESWGFLLADVIHHASNALAQQTQYPREYVLKALKDRIVRELEDPTHVISGRFTQSKVTAKVQRNRR
jgi:hypothetical protein